MWLIKNKKKIIHKLFIRVNLVKLINVANDKTSKKTSNNIITAHPLPIDSRLCWFAKKTFRNRMTFLSFAVGKFTGNFSATGINRNDRRLSTLVLKIVSSKSVQLK